MVASKNILNGRIDLSKNCKLSWAILEEGGSKSKRGIM